MKGKKAYLLALAVHEKMYSEGHNFDLQKELYGKYFSLIKSAAYKGYKDALYDMGQQYEDIGYLGIPNPNFNIKRCIYWYNKACDKNHAEACNNLASFYEEGKGVKRDLNFALELYKRSADLGSRIGKKNYRLMLKDMSEGGKYYSVNYRCS